MQVQQHHAALQQEKETAGIQKLQASLPKLCRPVLALALQDCEFDAERALLMLRQFQSDTFDSLRDINRRRKRLEAHTARRAPPDDASDSGDSGSPRRKRSRSSHKHSKHKKSGKHKRHKDKHHKRRRRRSPRSGSEDDGALEFGAFGIIRESDYALKKPEFAAWATEVKHIDIESLPRCARAARAVAAAQRFRRTHTHTPLCAPQDVRSPAVLEQRRSCSRARSVVCRHMACVPAVATSASCGAPSWRISTRARCQSASTTTSPRTRASSRAPPPPRAPRRTPTPLSTTSACAGTPQRRAARC